MKINFKCMAIYLCMVLLAELILTIPAFTAENSDKQMTIPCTSSQQRRMWCQSDYNSEDWIYEPWILTSWGRVHYLRFASNDLNESDIKKATIKLDARARASEKTVYLAAISLSDTSALTVESNLSSLTSTNRVTTNDVASKLMTDKQGYYLSDVASSVVAYTKTTASDNTTTDNTYTNDSGTLLFNHPMEIELDVTNAVKNAFSNGNHVQFVLSATKDVLTSDYENLYDMENFKSFSNGVIYDENGNVIKNTNSMLNMDTSIPVCGNANFYTPGATDDTYFSWLYIVRESISLEIEYQSNDNIFNEFQSSIKDGRGLEAKIDSISLHLDADTYELYNRIRIDGKLNDELYTLAKSSTSLEEFNEGFITTVNNFYFQGQEIALRVKADLGGRRGTLSSESLSAIPYASYGQIKAYDELDNLLKNYTVNVKNGLGYYNVYEKEDRIKKLEITLTSDKKGTTPISSTRTLYMEDLNLPSVFITEITARQVKTYYPDTNGQENRGSYEQNYQFIELYNYTDTPVDLNEYSFIYSVEKEHKFDFIWESGADKILSPGELFVVGVYTADSAELGHKYDTDNDISDYWEAFNAFYDTDVPLTSRAMIACVKSGDGATTLDGLCKLMRSYEAGISVSAEIRKGNETVTKIDLSDDNMPTSSYSFQFTPSSGDTKEENILFCSGNFPNKLMSEQKLDFCEKVYFSNSDKQKVMSYNILATNNAGQTIADRYPLFKKTINDFDVDIVGLQEVNKLWIDLLKGTDLSDYGCVEGYSSYGKTYSSIGSDIWELMNPIYYKKDKYTLLDSGGAYLTPDGNLSTEQWDSINLKRTLTYAVLQNNKTGNVTSFINTHLVLSGKQARVEQVKLLYKKGEELKKKYGGGIIIVGDHNFIEGSEPYHTYENSGVVTDAKYQTTNHTSGSTTPTFNTNSPVYGSPIDLCFISPEDYIVEKYDVFHGVYPEGTVSDHSAVYVELLEKPCVDSYETKITSYNANEQCATVEFDGKNECVVIFANYENHQLLNVDIVEYTADSACYAVINQKDISFTLDSGDKIFLWENVTDAKSLCDAYVIKDDRL